jgi:hypothetical protein
MLLLINFIKNLSLFRWNNFRFCGISNTLTIDNDPIPTLIRNVVFNFTIEFQIHFLTWLIFQTQYRRNKQIKQGIINYEK